MVPGEPGITNDDTWYIDYSTNCGATWCDITAATATSETAYTDHTLSLNSILETTNASAFRVRVKGATVGTADDSGTVDWDASKLEVKYNYSTAGAAGAGEADSKVCFKCHGRVGDFTGAKTVANRDYYGTAGGAMTTVAESIERLLPEVPRRRCSGRHRLRRHLCARHRDCPGRLQQVDLRDPGWRALDSHGLDHRSRGRRLRECHDKHGSAARRSCSAATTPPATSTPSRPTRSQPTTTRCASHVTLPRRPASPTPRPRARPRGIRRTARGRVRPPTRSRTSSPRTPGVRTRAPGPCGRPPATRAATARTATTSTAPTTPYDELVATFTPAQLRGVLHLPRRGRLRLQHQAVLPGRPSAARRHGRHHALRPQDPRPRASCPPARAMPCYDCHNPHGSPRHVRPAGHHRCPAARRSRSVTAQARST